MFHCRQGDHLPPVLQKDLVQLLLLAAPVFLLPPLLLQQLRLLQLQLPRDLPRAHPLGEMVSWDAPAAKAGTVT